MTEVVLIFPHQLFEDCPISLQGKTVYLIEEYMFFEKYIFHKQKLLLHRASMQFYKQYLQNKGNVISYINAKTEFANVKNLIAHLATLNIQKIHVTEVTDNWLQKHIVTTAHKFGIAIQWYPNPQFMNTVPQITEFFKDKKTYFQTDFYVHQRKKYNLLIENNKPVGGKWTYDAENRAKYPKNTAPPNIKFPAMNEFYKEAKTYIETNFEQNYGLIEANLQYPCTFNESKIWLQNFLETRFQQFGVYEDAIVANEVFLNHSVLTPMLNIGLLTPTYIIDQTILFTVTNAIPLNSVEGFIRQIIGWREFIRAVYELEGTKQRTTNFWNFNRPIPSSFWDGTTGIVPIDITIKKILKTGYCHHIERLMVLGNFMLLCEFNPNQVHTWFMEMFIDAYDWVMVPNVYGMTQFADGGLMTTKPYISGSNYLNKMSNYEKGSWQTTWDGLFWHFMHKQSAFFLSNPRLGMLVHMFNKMDKAKQNAHLQAAESYLQSLN